MSYWDRETLKGRAKDVLSKTYWMSLLIIFVAGAISGIYDGYSKGEVYFTNNFVWSWPIRFDIIIAILSAAMGLISAAGIISILYKVFVVNPLEVGKKRFFTLCRYSNVKFDGLFFGFKGGRYVDNVKTMFLRDLYTFLWSLLFVIPGIVKYYGYKMVPYILAENPDISTKRALEISEQATRGEKWNMFVLDLSFVGWFILCFMTCGIGFFFLAPYIEATQAELYGALRQKAVQLGISTKDEIGAEL